MEKKMRYYATVGCMIFLALAANTHPCSATPAQDSAKKINVIFTGDAIGNVAPCG